MSSSFSLQRCKGVNIVKDIDRKMHEVQDAQRPVLILVAATIVLAFVLAFTGQTFDQKNKGMRSAVESTGIDAPQLRHSDDGKAYTRSLTPSVRDRMGSDGEGDAAGSSAGSTATAPGGTPK